MYERFEQRGNVVTVLRTRESTVRIFADSAATSRQGQVRLSLSGMAIASVVRGCVATMLCDHCGDCYELLADVRVLNQLSNLFGESGRYGSGVGTWNGFENQS